MYINKIDELIDKMFDLFYSEISSKITKQENFAQVFPWINKSISTFIKNIDMSDIKKIFNDKTNLQKISEWIANLKNIENFKEESENKISFAHIYKERFEEAMNDDFNTPLALSVIFELITETNKLIAENKLSASHAKEILNFWEKINKIFGLEIASSAIKIPQKIKDLAEERKIAKTRKDFVVSDELRKKIEGAGYTLEDLPNNNYIIKQK